MLGGIHLQVKTKQKLVDAARTLIIEKGYTATTTKLIAKQAGVSEMTLFRYFPQKKDIVCFALDHELWQPTFEKVTIISYTGDVKKDLTAFASVFNEQMDERFIRLLIGLRSPDIFEIVKDKLMTANKFKHALTNYLQRFNVDAVLMSEIFMSSFFGYIFAKISYENQFYVSSKTVFMDYFLTNFTKLLIV